MFLLIFLNIILYTTHSSQAQNEEKTIYQNALVTFNDTNTTLQTIQVRIF